MAHRECIASSRLDRPGHHNAGQCPPPWHFQAPVVGLTSRAFEPGQVPPRARLVDWLRFEPASERVLNALLTDNRGGGLSTASFARLNTAITESSEAFFATPEARQRVRRSKSTANPQQSDGRLTLVLDSAGPRLFVTWSSLPSGLAEEAKIAARAAGWRPQLWATGARLHSDIALGDGPFALTHLQAPASEEPAYSGTAAVFGEGSQITTALAGRAVRNAFAGSSVCHHSIRQPDRLGLHAGRARRRLKVCVWSEKSQAIEGSPSFSMTRPCRLRH